MEKELEGENKRHEKCLVSGKEDGQKDEKSLDLILGYMKTLKLDTRCLY